MFSSLYLCILAVEGFAQAQRWPFKSRAGACSQLGSAALCLRQSVLPPQGGQAVRLGSQACTLSCIVSGVLALLNGLYLMSKALF